MECLVSPETFEVPYVYALCSFLLKCIESKFEFYVFIQIDHYV